MIRPYCQIMDTTERVKQLQAVLDDTLRRISHEAALYRHRAQNQRLYHTSFGATLAVLGVAAPALVTYQTQHQSATFQLIAIFLTGVVGAAGALQATFRWGDRFRRTSLTALALEELESNTQLARNDIFDTDDAIKIYQKAYELNVSSQKELQRIVRQHIEGEVALVSPKPEENPEPPGGTEPSSK